VTVFQEASPQKFHVHSFFQPSYFNVIIFLISHVQKLLWSLMFSNTCNSYYFSEREPASVLFSV